MCFSWLCLFAFMVGRILVKTRTSVWCIHILNHWKCIWNRTLFSQFSLIIWHCCFLLIHTLSGIFFNQNYISNGFLIYRLNWTYIICTHFISHLYNLSISEFFSACLMSQMYDSCDVILLCEWYWPCESAAVLFYSWLLP